jgi:hexosaminidase
MIAPLLLAAIPSIVPWPRVVQIGSTAFRLTQPRVAARLLVQRDAALGDEGYSLSIGPQGVNARANTRAGLFYAMQTFGQLNLSAGALVHPIEIRDWPVYRWRGVHLDAARHFFDVRTVERYIDVAAHYKLNVFHWHLTDDQAWRLPVPGYPALTARGYSYSEAQIREVVAYAAKRYVMVLPEIEMPAHASAAIAAYPQFGCGRSGVFCATSGTFGFLQNALNQVFRLFPASDVHAGGDEVPGWYDESGFMSRIEPYVRAHGRRMVGWNEILSSRLSVNAIVMAWNSMRRAAEAARRGNDTVVTGWPLYFDAAQGDAAQEPRATPHMSTLAEVYSWDVMPPGLSAGQQSRVLGGEATLWTERIRTPQHLFYMLLPRELALAEMLWTPRASKNWTGFLQRLPAQFAWLDSQGYAFRIPNAAIDVTGEPIVFQAIPGQVQSVNAWTSAARVRIVLTTPIGGTIRYTLDGKMPVQSAPAFVKPLSLSLSRSVAVVVRAATFYRGRAGATTECRIHRVGEAALPRVGTARSFSALVSP